MRNAFVAGLMVIAMALAGCAARSHPAAAAPSGLVDLIGYAASDFRTHVAPTGVEFRNVHPAVKPDATGYGRQLLCGEYRAPGQAWSPFVTIKTDPYENWLGAGSEGHCAGPDTRLDMSVDASEALTAEYRAR